MHRAGRRARAPIGTANRRLYPLNDRRIQCSSPCRPCPIRRPNDPGQEHEYRQPVTRVLRVAALRLELAWMKNGEPCWVRTSDLLIKSQLLYRLS